MLKTDRLLLRLGKSRDIPAIIQYYQTNQRHLEPFEPHRPNNFYTAAYWAAELQARMQDHVNRRAVRLFLFPQAAPAQVIGVVNLTNLIWGNFQAGSLGYGLAADCQGQGYMTEAVSRLISYAFKDLGLHRIMANYMPHNHRSGRVLKRLGFRIEGYARNYVLINGQWQDHILTSLINPAWKPLR